MPQCKKCNTKFPVWFEIEGKFKNLGSRKYCLECSPYKKHNVKKLEIVQSSLCTCLRCGKIYNYDKSKGTTYKKCNSCMVNERKDKLKIQAVNYKGGKCFICGYNRCVKALQFHHVCPEEKLFNISGSHCYSWEKIRNEIEKCILLCGNCHTEYHAGLIKIDLSFKNYNNKDFFEIKTEIKEIKEIKEKLIKACKISKEELEKLIWKMPTTKIAKEYNVSDKAVEKWCKKFNISKPPRGYWAKLRAH